MPITPLLLITCLASPPSAPGVLPRVAAPCVRDCNGNGIEDGVDIGSGTSQDLNRNGVPDECEVVTPAVEGSILLPR